MDWKRLKWGNWPYWVKGGVIAVIIGTPGFLYMFSTGLFVPRLSKLDFLIGFFINSIVYFIIGALIGFGYSIIKKKIKNKRQRI